MLPSLIALCLLSSVFTETTPVARVDDPFVMDVATIYTVENGLPEATATSIALLPGDRPIACVAGKLLELKENEWVEVPNPPDFDALLLATQGETLWVAGEDRLAKREGETWSVYRLPPKRKINRIATYKESCLVATDAGLSVAGSDPIAAPPGEILSVASDGGKAAVGSADGLLILSEEGPKVFDDPPTLFPKDDNYAWAPRDVTALAFEAGALWFGDSNGVGRWDGASWKLYTGAEGLPVKGFTCAAAGAGAVWFGTRQGAIRFDGDRWAYRSGKRWLPHEKVNSIAVTAAGDAWVATDGGVSLIQNKTTTLAERAVHFEQVNGARHVRDGFMVRCYFDAPGALETAKIRHTDNDGLYTAMAGAAQCFRYGATKDPEAKRLAKRSFDALRRLEEATPIEGFPARSIVPIDTWPEDPNKGWSQATNLKLQEEDPLWKNILPRWPASPDGKYWWKCDTSSDEICGHFFFYGVYHDLVAETEEEKAEVVELVRKITNHIVDHEFTLTDHDGKPTRWAQWGPAYTNSRGGWADRGLQGVEILSFLNVAIHIAGDRKFRDAADYLRDEHAYHIMAINGRAYFPPANVVPWDNNLAFLSYYGLLNYEQNTELREIYKDSIDQTWLFSSSTNDPFFSFVTAAVRPEGEASLYRADDPGLQQPLARAVQTLREAPELLIGWDTRNSHRLDIQFDPTPSASPSRGWSRLDRQAIPMNERTHVRINSDHFSLDSVPRDERDLDPVLGGGMYEYESTFYLLPYYMGLYHGFLE